MFSGCSFGADDTWGILWANTPVGVTDRQPCPGQADTLGITTLTYYYCYVQYLLLQGLLHVLVLV